MEETIPDDNEAYKKPEYWNSRFEKEESYEWLVSYEKVSEMLKEYIKKEVVGCGNSQFSCGLYSDGFHNITNIDYSEIVIKNMSEKYKDSSMKWLTQDMRKLEFENEEFDCVIDKAGMDALVTDEGDPWDPNEQTKEDVKKTCESISRVLKKGGYFLQISFQQAHFRRKYLEHEEYGWELTYKTIPEGLGYFLYILHKK